MWIEKFKTVLNEYTSQTIASIVNAFFYIVLYPMVIPVVGAAGYGEVIYAIAATSFISIAMSSGFDLPALKYLSEPSCDSYNGGKYISNVLNIKIAIFLLGVLLLLAILKFNDYSSSDLLLLSLINVFGTSLILNWAFIANEKSHVIAYVTAFSKFLALVAILIFIKKPSDNALMIVIMGLSNLGAGIYLLIYVYRKLGYKWVYQDAKSSCKVFVETLPFFWSGGITLLKYRSLEVLIGSLFGMREVALYDLANKIYTLPAMLVTAINSSIFPKFRSSRTQISFRKIIYIQTSIAMIVIISCAVFGPWVVNMLGRGELNEAYYILLLLSLNVFPFMIVGCVIYLKFLPLGKGNLILSNQVVALIAYVFALGIFLQYNITINSIILALVLSGIVEMAFCFIIYRFVLSESIQK